MNEIFEEIRKERKKQDEKWGEQNHLPIEWIAILTEEVGEASKAALEARFMHFVPIEKLEKYGESCTPKQYHLHEYRKELVQVAAVAVQMIESFDRNENLHL